MEMMNMFNPFIGGGASEDKVARAEIAAIKDGETLDSFSDVETALDNKANTTDILSLDANKLDKTGTAVKATADSDGNNIITTYAKKTDLDDIACTYRGTYTTIETLNAATGDENDYAFYKHTDTNGNTVLDKYIFIPTEQVDLPEGYTQLLYIESNGTQYIDTGINPNRDTKFYLKFSPVEYHYGTYYFGTYGLSDRGYYDKFSLSADNAMVNLQVIGGDNFIDISVGDIAEISVEYPYYSVDGTTLTLPTVDAVTFSGTNTICLFTAKRDGSISTAFNSYMRLYACQIYENDGTTLSADYIPCKNASNVLGLYDLVNEIFLPNQGSDTFIAGPQANGYWSFEYSIPGNLFSSTQFAVINSGITSTDVAQIETNKTNISSVSEQLGIAVATLTAEIAKVGATFKGIFTSQEALDAAAADENDVAILQTTDANGNVFYAINTYKEVEPAGNLPEGYTQLLYIQSSGTQYIDTGVNLSSSRGFYMKFMPTALENNTAFFGLHGFDNRGYSVNYKLEISNYDMYFRYVDQFRVDIAINEISEVDFKPRILSVNGTATTITDAGEWYFSGTNTAALFAYKDGTSFIGKSSMRLYEFKMYDNDKTTLLRHFIPVRNSNNEVGLYDLVEGRFYGNEGTGSFTAGPSADGYWTANYTVMHSADGKQNTVLGSWTAGSATSHSTPTSSDTVLEVLQKIDNNQRLDESNISAMQQTIGDINTVLEEVL